MIAESKEITVKAADGGSFSAYMALPKTTPAPAIIVITSIFGTDQEMRDLVDRYAEAGFIGIVPDIFWRIEPGPLSHTDEQQRQRAYARMKAFDVDKGVSDIKSIAEMLTSMKEYNGKFAVAGFCFGGRYAFLSATRLGASAAVAFHGTAIGQDFGDNDAAVPMEEVEAIKAALKHNPQAEIFVYPGAQHGYTSPSRPAYDAEATRLSFERAMRVLETLK